MTCLRIQLHRLLGIVPLALFAAGTAHATPLITTFAQYSTGPVTDADGPQPGGALSSSVATAHGASRCSITGSCAVGAVTSANASATQQETPFGTFSSLVADATFYNGSSSYLSMTARTTWEESPSASGPTNISLLIKPGELAIVDFASIVFSHDSSASFRIELSVNGSAVFASEAVLRGGPTGLVLSESGTDLGGTAFADASFPQNVRGYRFDPLLTTLDLGNLTTSDVVRYTMEVTVRAQGFETGGYARVGDPFDLSNDGSRITLSTIPEPSVALLLGSGLALLSFQRGREPRAAFIAAFAAPRGPAPAGRCRSRGRRRRR